MEKTLEVAYAEKASGNEFFREGQLDEASKAYSKALLAVNQAFREAEDETQLKSLVQEVQIPGLLNLALCYLKLNRDVKNAVVHCTSVLQIEPGNIKALYRRAQAHLSLQDFDLARQDLVTALNLDPANSALKELWADFTRQHQTYQAKSRRIAQAAMGEEEKPSLRRELLWGLFRCCRRRMHEASLATNYGH
jgi:tetratricopeptide (TPR) repeat protein